MKKNTISNVSNNMNKNTNNATMRIATAIQNFLSSSSNIEWMKIEKQIYATVNCMLNSTRWDFSLKNVMLVDRSYVADELASNLKWTLLKDDMRKLKEFVNQNDENFKKWGYVNSMLHANRLYSTQIKNNGWLQPLEDYEGAGHDNSMEIKIHNEDYLHYVMTAIDQLPNSQKWAMELMTSDEYGGLSSKELAEMLGVSSSTFTKRVHDARKNLRKMCA